MSEIGRYIDERLDDSITSIVPARNPVDRQQPLTFTEWLQYNNFLYTNTQDFLQRYQSYLNNWFEVNNIARIDSEKIVQEYYTTLINEIVLNYTTIDEKRYLQNLDLKDSRDLTLAVPFFAKKIKDICIYFTSLRDEAQTAVTQYNLKGSNYGTSTSLYNLFVASLNTDDLTDDIRTLNLSLSSIRNNTTIELEDIYDTYSDYYDVSPVIPASAYGSFNDSRAEFFSLNQYPIDPDLFINLGYAILRAILSYPFYLIELGENLLINNAVTVTDSSRFLKDSNYTNLISVSSVAALNLALQAQEITKYIGTDFYYAQTGVTTFNPITGLLFKADAEFANILNKRFPTVAAVPSEEYLQTGKEIGLFFKPDKEGLLSFTSFKFTPSINFNNLEPNTVYFFPDPYKYGNITSNTRSTFKTPYTFTEDNTFNKINVANGYRFGDSNTDPYFQIFRAYQSREQSLNNSNFGLARYSDPQDFFSGEQKSIWANRDIYELSTSFKFPIDLRTQKLLSLNKTLVQHKTDIYGNEYAIYKAIEPNKTIGVPEEGSFSDLFKTCLAIDGYTFFDSISGYIFDYSVVDPSKGYSGVTLRTVETTPPSFSLSGEAYNLNSYTFQPETFCDDLATVDYDCSIGDGFTFAYPNGRPVPDYPSDSPSFDLVDAALYYNILIEAGVNKFAPDYRATFAFPGDFTFEPAASALNLYDGFFFTVNGVEPCAPATIAPQLYVEKANFANIRLFGRETVLNRTLSSFSDTRRSIYDTKNTLYGEAYYRNSNSSIIEPLSSALSAIFTKYTDIIQKEIYTKLINFDVYYDTIQIETDNYIVFDQLQFDYDINKVVGGNAGINTVYQGDNQIFEKFSTVWFNEPAKELLFCKTTLFYEYSATNYKIIYPKIYSYDLATQQLVQLYPTIKDEALTFNMLHEFTLSGKNIEVNIVEIDKPILTYNDENNLYKITYIGRDIIDVFYIVSTLFRYVDGILSLVNTTMYKLGSDVYNENFANPTVGQAFETYTVLGSAVGITDTSSNTFTWGDGTCPIAPTPTPAPLEDPWNDNQIWNDSLTWTEI